MLTLPKRIIQVLRCFEEVFSERVWEWAKVLLIGAILAPGERTVTAILRVMGLNQERQFQNYHRVLNRATWSSRALSRLLLRLLVAIFVPEDAPIVVGIDETIERRRGSKIAAKGIYRDPVRSSKEFFVKTSGLRWISMMLLTPIPWAQRVWALPFFTVLAASRRYNKQHRRRHKKLTDWGRQMIRQLRRWLPERRLVVVADSSYSVLELLACAARMIEPVAIVTRLRLDAALYDPAPVRKPRTKGRPRKKGARRPTLAKLLTDPVTDGPRITVAWYGGTTRTVPPGERNRGLVSQRTATGCDPLGAHLGVETQRQWSGLAILRTTPALLALFSLVTVFAHQLLQGQPLPVRQAAWYTKALPTFSDTLAFVRQHLWPVTLSYLSPAKPDMIEIPRALFDRLTQTLAFAA